MEMKVCRRKLRFESLVALLFLPFNFKFFEFIYYLFKYK